MRRFGITSTISVFSDRLYSSRLAAVLGSKPSGGRNSSWRGCGVELLGVGRDPEVVGQRDLGGRIMDRVGQNIGSWWLGHPAARPHPAQDALGELAMAR